MPGYWTLFVLDDVTSQNLKDRVDRYCGIHSNVDSIYDNLINGIRFDQVVLFFSFCFKRIHLKLTVFLIRYKVILPICIFHLRLLKV